MSPTAITNQHPNPKATSSESRPIAMVGARKIHPTASTSTPLCFNKSSEQIIQILNGNTRYSTPGYHGSASSKTCALGARSSIDTRSYRQSGQPLTSGSVDAIPEQYQTESSFSLGNSHT